ncbi:MAG: hypothetical protein ACJA04_001184 [Cellvibrionaceae bacterium]
MNAHFSKIDYRRFWLKSVRRLLLSLVVLSLLSSCSGALIPVALSLGKSLLLASTNNYSSDYAESIDAMLSLLLSPKPKDDNLVDRPSSRSSDGASEMRSDSAGSLQLDVALLKDGSPPVVIEDGAVLYDAGEKLLDSDRIKIVFGTNQPCYVYVVGIDATGWVTPVFPSSESFFLNPISAHQPIQIPEGSRWYALDQYRGVETFYFMASRVRRPDIEKLLAEFSAKVRPPMEQYQPVENPTIASRGIVAIDVGKPARVQNQKGQTHNIAPPSFIAGVDGIDLVVTRWFYHK